MKFDLENGLEVVLEENHASPVVAFQAWVGVGAADEPKELAGVSHFLEHMLFKGTKRRGVGQIAREVEGAGGDINAWTSYDETVYHLVMASAFFDTGLDVLSDALIHSSFDAAELEKERGVILEEVKQGLDDPDRMAALALFDGAFSPHPYGRPVIGTEQTVEAMGRAQIFKYYRQHYTGHNTTLVIVGDFDAKKAATKIRKLFGAMKPGQPRPTEPRRPPTRNAPRIKVLARDVKENSILMGVGIPSIRHEDIPALDLLAVALGQGESSRLHVQVVRNQQVAKGAYSYAFAARDAGMLVLGASVGLGEPVVCVASMLDQLLALTREKIGSAELDKARAILESERIFDRETVQGFARKLGYFAVIAGDVDYEAHYMARLQSLTPDDLLTVAQRYMRANTMTAVVQVPRTPVAAKRKAQADALKAKISKVFAAAEGRADRRHAAAIKGVGVAVNALSKAGRPLVVSKDLAGGPRVLIMRDTSVPIVALRAMWQGGLRYENTKTNGASNLIASLLNRGTKTRDAEEIAHTVEGMAGAISGYTGRNSLGMSAEFLAKHWDKGLDLVVDCILNPSFSDAELDKEKRIVLDDIRSQGDNVAHTAFRLFHTTMWNQHPYRMDMLGTVESVSALSRRRLMVHYRNHYSPANLTIAIVGDIDPEQVLQRLHSLFPPGAANPVEAPELAVEAKISEPLQSFKFEDKEQAHVVLGYPGTTLDNADRFGLEILSQILSGQGGRLFDELREKRGLVYRVSAFSLEGIEPGYFAVYLAASPGNLQEALGLVRQTIADILKIGVSVDEVERAKRYLVGTHSIGLQRKSSIAAALAFHEAYGPGWAEYNRFPDRIASIKAADIKRLARKYLAPEREVLAVVKPPDDTPAAATRAAKR